MNENYGLLDDEELDLVQNEGNIWESLKDQHDVEQQLGNIEMKQSPSNAKKTQNTNVKEKQKKEKGKRKTKINKLAANQIRNEVNFYNQNENGRALINHIIDIIRHQQYILDNQDHMKQYNIHLLNIWRRQINLLDAYERFEYYKQIGKLKELMKKLSLIIGGSIEEFLLGENNKELIRKKEIIIEFLKQDLHSVKNDNEFFVVMLESQKSHKYQREIEMTIDKSNEKELNKNKEENDNYQFIILNQVINFILNLLKFDENQNTWRCLLCNDSAESCVKLIDHCNKKHLQFLGKLLLGEKDKCFSTNCNDRRGNWKSENYDFSKHLKCSHSQIYQEDVIFTKLYLGQETQKAFQYQYGKDAKNWKQKFQRDLTDWLDNVDPGAKQYLIDNERFNKRGEPYFQDLRNWMENDQSLLNSEVEGAFGDFDQLSFLLKWSWSSVEQMKELEWITRKLKPEPRRILMIEAIADLLDTKQSLIAQLHRYLYLGVFNFKITQKELNSRIESLESQLLELGMFQCVIYNVESFSQQCLFEEILCNKNSIHFKSRKEMYEHYFDYHIGVFYALNSPQLQTNLKQGKTRINMDKQMMQLGHWKINSEDCNLFEEKQLGEIIHYLHDHHEADVKTRSKRFMRSCRKNFQLKSICCECNRELNHFGEVYWREKLVGKQSKPNLILRHRQKVQEVIEVYKESVREKQVKLQLEHLSEEQQQHKGLLSQWSEIKIIDEQCQLFKIKNFQEMKKEVLIDDKGRESQCKDCNKKQKGFNPQLKELKEEYFKLPFPDEEEVREQQLVEKKKTQITLEIKESDPQFIKTQKAILNRMIKEKEGLLGGRNKKGGGLAVLSEQMDNGYFKINSFPKLVQIYGEISEKKDQNPNRVLSQPILTGYMKVLFQTPLIYVPGTSIIYELQPQWLKVKHQFKLFGSSDLQRQEFIQMLESHPIMQNHTYQMSNLTKLCVDQVDLMFQLNKHLLKENKRMTLNKKLEEQEPNDTEKYYQQQQEQKQQYQQERIGFELTKTSDLLYFEGILHRAQVQFLIQQFRIWQEVFENVRNSIQILIVEESKFKRNQLNNQVLKNLDVELNQFYNLNNQKKKQLGLMLIFGMFYLKGANQQMQFISNKIIREIKEDSSLFDFMLSEHDSNQIQFVVEFHILPIIVPLIEQFIHPIFVGTLLQIFQLNCKRDNIEREDGLIESDSFKYYLNLVYEGLSKLSIKRCIPLFEFYKSNQKKRQNNNEISQARERWNYLTLSQEELEKIADCEEEVDEKWKLRREKLKSEQRWFQLKMLQRLDGQQKIDMQCRYVLAKRSLMKVINSQSEEPLVDCDLRWAMQVGELFCNSIRKRAEQGSDEEMRAARDHLEELKCLKHEADHYLYRNEISTPQDFLFKRYKNKNGQEFSSDLRSLLEEIMKDDQRNRRNQVFNTNNYKFIHKLKLAYFIPMEKKLQDILNCVEKLRSLPHRQTYRSLEKFHKYNFRELELLAFPEIYATGQGFQQYMAPKIERSQIVIDIDQQDRQKAQEALQNLKEFKLGMRNQSQQQSWSRTEDLACKNNQKMIFEAQFEDFTTHHRQGQSIPMVKKAILQLKQENYLKWNLASAFIYDMQKVSVIKVFQEASQRTNIKERAFQLEQEIEIQITGGEVLCESLKDQHVLKNFNNLLKKQTNWSNECQSFIKRLSEEAQNMKNKEGESEEHLINFIRLQEAMFLKKKREELSSQFKNIDLSQLDLLRQRKKVIDMKGIKIKQTNSSKDLNRDVNKSNSFSDVSDQLHSEVLRSINPMEEVVEQIQKQLSTFSSQFTSIGEDTRYRLLNKSTRVFTTRHAFVFWRYTQRMISRIFSYYTVVNGINFYEKQDKKTEIKQQQKESITNGQIEKNQNFEKEQAKIKELMDLPPIKGSKIYFKNKYKEQRAISFQKGTPFLFLTYTLYEFDKKTYQVVRGLNNFDLENDELLKQRQKGIDKKTYIKLTKGFAIYFHFMSKIITKCILNSIVEFKISSHKYQLYDYGMFGPCVGYTNRFEFQQRGSIHLHQLLYFVKNEAGSISNKLLEYWASIFSLWNLNKNSTEGGGENKDREFIEKFQLKHVCSSDCMKEENGKCRKGYPWAKRTKSYWKNDYLNRIYPRVQDEEESVIFMHDRDVVKFFNSSCIVEACGNDKIIDYITKYISKAQKQFECEEVQEQTRKQINGEVNKTKMYESDSEGSIGREVKDDDAKENQQINLKKQANDLVHQIISKKITPLQEAYCDLLDYPIFKTSFTCIKIAQVPLSEQFKMNTKTFKSFYDADNPDQDLKQSFKSTIWMKYLSRPLELENLTLQEYSLNFMWYGNKKRYKEKSLKQSKKNEKGEEVFYIDLNGQIVKQREKEVDVIINLSQVYYLEDLSYEPNLFYLAMLQLFWTHRQETWLKETGDNHEGFKRTYYKLYNDVYQDRARGESQQDEDNQNQQRSFMKIKKITFKEAVDQYKSLNISQQNFLKQVQFIPLPKKQDYNESQKCKQFFTYHTLMRARNSIIRLNGLLEREIQSVSKELYEEIKGILNYLRPDILINHFQKEKVIEVENQIVTYVTEITWNAIPSFEKVIFEELSSLLKSSNFNRLSLLINREQSQMNVLKKQENQEVLLFASQKKERFSNNVFEKFASSTDSKLSQREIEIFSNFNDNIEFPQHFRTYLTRAEFKSLKRVKMSKDQWNEYVPSDELSRIFLEDLNQQQKLAVLIQLHYFYQSQVQKLKNTQPNNLEEQEEEIYQEKEMGQDTYEGCLIHGGGGVGKSFIIDFMIQLYTELDVHYYILCPTQVAVQNLIKDKHDSNRIMTIHSFFHLNPNASIETSFNHFQSFLKYVQKEHFYPSSTSLLYPELSFYNCMMKVDKFTEKLRGVKVIMLEEISMIDPKFLSLLDVYLQISLSSNLPFGGIQVFGFGDSFQLQPVTHPPTYFFQSHIFYSNYFSMCLELTIPVRQADDLKFYEEILQPIRIGEFQNHQKYKNSFRLLRMRHLDDEINNETQFNLAQGLQAQVQRLQVDNQITFLYFENEEVTKENQLRAEQHVKAYQLKYQHQQQDQFRIFINAPCRLSFGVRSMKFDKLLMNISQNYEIMEELLNNKQIQLSYAQHFKLLPLTVKNYLFQILLPHVYDRAKQTQRIAQSFPQFIKLFKTASIIFRKNLDKSKHMINGQAALITDVQFDVDFKSDENLKKQAAKKEEKIHKYLIQGLIKRKQDNDQYIKFEMSSQLKEFVRNQLEQEDMNNINTLVDEDVLESEKLDFIQNGIQPKLKALRMKIEGKNENIIMDNIENFYQNLTVTIQSENIKGIIKQALQIISLLNRRLNQSDGRIDQQRNILESTIFGNKNALQLLGLSVLQNSLDTHLLKRAEFHLTQIAQNLSDEWTPIQISQLPINLAYARTIHTSQGATFDNICVKLNSYHLSRPGLLYTAFSRVRNLSQLYLQGEFTEDLFRDNVPEELKRFFNQNFIKAEEILNSTFFSDLLVRNQFNLQELKGKITEANELFRKKLLRQLPRRVK